MSGEPVRLGVLGLGRAFTLMLPTFTRDGRVRLVAAFDPSESATAAFARDFGGTAHVSPEALCADPVGQAPKEPWLRKAVPASSAKRRRRRGPNGGAGRRMRRV